ncbi:hypothetical protein F5Y13DRAFT_202634 [Hypoxylon sp. FL1857]|nr:hypothetical protein F5Y13DRAFT_202634 [Hypoxylon sp. FL1857]
MMLPNQFIVVIALALSSSFTATNALCRPPPPERDGPPDTSGLSWQVKTVDPGAELNGAQLTLRTVSGTPDTGIVVWDHNAPVIISNFHDGELHLGSARQNSHDTGPTAYLNLTTPGSDKMDRYEFGFANVTDSFDASTAKGSVDKAWVLSQLDPDYPKRKRLNHNFNADFTGFSLCPGGPLGLSSEWYQIFFLVGKEGQTWDNNGCENNVTIFTMGPETPPDVKDDGC